MLAELEKITDQTSDKEKFKLMVSALRNLDRRTESMSDWSGSQDMSVMNAIVDLKNEVRNSNSKQQQRLGSLETTTKNGFQELTSQVDTLNQRLANLESSQSEMVDLLKIIAKNSEKN